MGMQRARERVDPMMNLGMDADSVRKDAKAAQEGSRWIWRRRRDSRLRGSMKSKNRRMGRK